MKKVLPFIPFLVIFLLFISIYFAAYAEVLEPVQKIVNDGERIYLGKVGPGQSLYITVYGKARTGGKFGKGGTWQILRVLEVPDGWEKFNSKEMATYMIATIKPSPYAKDGKYLIKLRLEEDETKQQQLGSVTFLAEVEVDKNVLKFNVHDEKISTGVGQPYRVRITINNTGSASDVVEITSEGIPILDDYLKRKTVYVPAGKEVQTYYELISNEEKIYNVSLKITSKSSELMSFEKNLAVTVKSDLFGDIKAIKNGILIFPSILEPLYNLVALIEKISELR